MQCHLFLLYIQRVFHFHQVLQSRALVQKKEIGGGSIIVTDTPSVIEIWGGAIKSCKGSLESYRVKIRDILW